MPLFTEVQRILLEFPVVQVYFRDWVPETWTRSVKCWHHLEYQHRTSRNYAKPLRLIRRRRTLTGPDAGAISSLDKAV